MKKITFFLIFSSILGYSQSWNLGGNSATNPNTDYLGTKDLQPLILKTNNQERLKIDSDGKVTIKGVDGYGGAMLTLDGTNESNGIGVFQIGLSGCDGCWGLPKGGTAMRNLGGTHTIVLQMPNDNNDGSSYIGVNDVANGTWIKFFNNAIARFDGKVYAKEMQVKANVWADYVFQPHYDLKTLEQVEKHIKENGHLPNIPSAKEVKEKGINLAEMDSKLLEKIEELTLYSIEQNKEIKKLKEENRSLKLDSKRIEMLENQIRQILSKNQ